MVRTRTPVSDRVGQCELEALPPSEPIPLVVTAAGLVALGRNVPIGLAGGVAPAPWLLEGLAKQAGATS